ncbi:MAG: hydroxymethylpyrimidine/phosphomethylpyrimidine kinase, partial [Gammaproteobacteria bacterium]|nr:hydroxymethylpyrimidine/phosphomethylpyrimidine kinase [Gammaproteobacteria bacterium]
MSLPVVLCLSGHDPTGGAGIQADIETLFRLGCHPCTVVTALTEQDTVDVRAVHPQAPDAFMAQARTLIADLPVSAVKIGLLGSAGIAEAIAQLLDALPGVPLVLDPILAAGGGHPLASKTLAAVIEQRLLPRVDVLTPNSNEARQLAGLSELDECAARLVARGCRRVLVTGTHEDGD